MYALIRVGNLSGTVQRAKGCGIEPMWKVILQLTMCDWLSCFFCVYNGYILGIFHELRGCGIGRRSCKVSDVWFVVIFLACVTAVQYTIPGQRHELRGCGIDRRL